MKFQKKISIHVGKKQTLYAIGLVALTVTATALAIIKPHK